MNLPVEWTASLNLAGVLAFEVALMVGLAAALERLNRSAAWHRAVWQATIVGLLLVTGCELTGLARDAAGWGWKWARQAAGGRQPSLSPGRAANPPVDHPTDLDPVFRERVRERVGNLRKDSGGGKMAVAPASQPSREALFVGVIDAPDPFLSGRALPWPTLIWLVGTAALLGPMVLARCCLLLLRGKRLPPDGLLGQRVAELAKRLKLRRPVRIFEFTNLRGPIAYGVLRPTIGLPPGFSSGFTVPRQDVMLAHELAHLAAHDSAWQRMADVAAALLWWHPLAWWVRRRLGMTAEAAADEASLLVRDGPGLLAECLVQLASCAARGPSLPWVQATGPGFRSGLGKRIHRLVNLENRAWRPPDPVRNRLVKSVVPLALVSVAILGTAWMNAAQSGETNMKNTWNRSLATLALFAAVGAEPVTPQSARAEVRNEPMADAPLANQTLVQDARLLLEMGKLDSAEAKLHQAVQANPTDSQAQHYLALVGEARRGKQPQTVLAAAANPAAPLTAPSAAPSTSSWAPVAAPTPEAAAEEPAVEAPPPSVYRMDPRLLRRYGINPPYPPAAPSSRGKQQVEAKLNQIRLNEISLDSMPLDEAVKLLNDEARRRDPDKKGVNFIVSNVAENPPTSIDPTTGMPIPMATGDIGSTQITLRLHDVSMKDILDALTRVAARPLKYSVEDYGVVFSPGAGQVTGFVSPAVAPETSRNLVRTFRVDTNTFLPGLEGVFGIQFEASQETAERSTQIRKALRGLFVELGCKSPEVYYNDLTGMLMVRASAEDMEIAQATIETLGGRDFRTSGSTRYGTTSGGGSYGGGTIGGGPSGAGISGGGVTGGKRPNSDTPDAGRRLF